MRVTPNINIQNAAKRERTLAKLLVVDDEKTLVMALEAILGTPGHQVRAVVSGEEALEALEQEVPDIIIADVVMPGMDGLELEKAVRSQPDRADIPFLFISANTSRELESAIKALENTRILHKPFEVEDLFEGVEALLEA